MEKRGEVSDVFVVEGEDASTFGGQEIILKTHGSQNFSGECF